jgi:hypothetical protein
VISYFGRPWRLAVSPACLIKGDFLSRSGESAAKKSEVKGAKRLLALGLTDF